MLDCLLAARAQAIRALKVKMGDKVEETVLLSKLMAYCSKVCFKRKIRFTKVDGK